MKNPILPKCNAKNEYAYINTNADSKETMPPWYSSVVNLSRRAGQDEEPGWGLENKLKKEAVKKALKGYHTGSAFTRSEGLPDSGV